MTRADIISQWAGSVQFAVVSTPRRLKLSSLGGGERERLVPWDFVEVDARGVKGATIYWSVNGQTASSALMSTFTTSANAILTVGADRKFPNFRLPPDSIDRVTIRATSISVVSTTNATVIFINTGRF